MSYCSCLAFSGFPRAVWREPGLVIANTFTGEQTLPSHIFNRLKQWFNDIFESDAEPSAEADAAAVTEGDAALRKRRKRRRRSKPAAAETVDAASAPAEAPVQARVSAPAASVSSSVTAVDDTGVSGAAPSSLGQKKQLGGWLPPQVHRQSAGEVLFPDFPLDNRILKAVLHDLQFQKCTPIQALSLPYVMQGVDIAGKAQTGTGKTAVFLISLLQAFLRSEVSRKLNQPFGLVLAPTRELALQIAKDAEMLSAYTSLRTVAVFGGMDYDRQRRLLGSGCDLVVATPGRLIDYLRSQVVDFSALQVLVLDEADRMLDMGFIPDVKRIISHLPPASARQTMLFSATLSPDIMNLASRWMRPGPAVLETEPEHVVADGIDEVVYACTSHEKLPILLWHLRQESCQRALIFRNRRKDVEDLHFRLLRYGVAAEMLSGDVDQKKRLRLLEEFRNGKIRVIVATDVAGRGLHVDNVTHVFNYDLPYEAEDYVHRIGRTARAGQKGRAVSFAGEDCAFVIPDIEKFIGRPLLISQAAEEMLVLPDKDQQPNSSSYRHRDGASAPRRDPRGGGSSGGGRPPRRSSSGPRR